MANNRVYLYCTVCNERGLIGKTLAQGYYLPNGTDDMGARVAAFLDRHFMCCPKAQSVPEGSVIPLDRYHGTAVELRFEHHWQADREVPALAGGEG